MTTAALHVLAAFKQQIGSSTATAWPGHVVANVTLNILLTLLFFFKAICLNHANCNSTNVQSEIQTQVYNYLCV